MTEETGDTGERLLDAALAHVPFDGWSEATFRAAVADAGVDMTVARGLFPRGAVDMALAYHRRGDDAMVAKLAETDMTGLSFREQVKLAVKIRIEQAADREAVRRGTTLFSLPMYAADGAKAIWGTVDAIWTALGDTSEDINWYSKRATLSGVYSSTVLFWLGDDSPGHQATWDFLDRRIDNVMQFEKLKADVQKNPLLKPLLVGPSWLAEQIRRPSAPTDLPGRRTGR